MLIFGDEWGVGGSRCRCLWSDVGSGVGVDAGSGVCVGVGVASCFCIIFCQAPASVILQPRRAMQ